MAEIYKFSETYTFTGEWWLPGQENKKIIGTLNYDPENRIQLNLEGFFEGGDFEVIIGYASGNCITLLNCFATTLASPFHNLLQYVPTQIFANAAIIGFHTNGEQDIQLEWARLEVNDIKAWSCLTGIDNREYLRSFAEGNNSFILPYKLPDAQGFFSDDDVEVTINAAINVPSLIPPPTEIVFRETNYFKIINKSKSKGLFFYEYVDAIRKFVSLAMRDNVNIINLVVRPEGSKEDAHVLYYPIEIDLDYIRPRPSMTDMFFILPKFQDRTCDLFKNWLEGYRKMMRVYSLYFCKIKGMLHNTFLTKAQALEEFHRTVTGLDRNYRTRMENLFETYNDIMQHTGDKEVFAQLMLDHRDFYSHWFKKKEDKVFRDIHLDLLSRDANLLLEMCLLSQMGFDDKEITNLVEECHPYRGYLGIGRPDGEGVFPPPRTKWKPGVI